MEIPGPSKNWFYQSTVEKVYITKAFSIVSIFNSPFCLMIPVFWHVTLHNSPEGLSP